MVMPATAFGRIVNRVLFPVMAQVQDERERLANAYERALAIVALISLPLSAFLWVVAPEFIPADPGAGVDRGGPAVPPVHHQPAVPDEQQDQRRLHQGRGRGLQAGPDPVRLRGAGRRRRDHRPALGGRWRRGLRVVAMGINWLNMAQLGRTVTGLDWGRFARAQLPAVLLAVVIGVAADAGCRGGAVRSPGQGAGGARGRAGGRDDRPGGLPAASPAVPRAARHLGHQAGHGAAAGRGRARRPGPRRMGSLQRGRRARRDRRTVGTPRGARRRRCASCGPATAKLTGPLRGLPSLLIIGAQRSGTTSLFNYLAQHPHVLAPLGKEIHYFDLHYARGIRWYRGRFPFSPRLRPPASSRWTRRPTISRIRLRRSARRSSSRR